MDDNQNSGIIQMEPEEVAPGVEKPEEISGSIPPQYPTDIPVYEEKNNTWKFILGIVLFFAIVFGLVYWFFLRGSGINNSISTSKDPVTLTYWGLWDDKTVFAKAIEAYQKKNPHVTINYEMLDPVQYRERLIARSQTGNGPDIFRYHNTWIPEIQEVISPLPTEIMSNEEFNATFYPIHQSDLKVGESYYGIPLMIDGMILAYNKEILNQAGILNPPTLWVGGDQDVVSVARKLTVRTTDGPIVTSGMAIGTATNVEHFGELFSILLYLNGGDFNDLTSPSSIEALELYRSFAEDGYWNATMPNSVTAFIQGKTAMIVLPSWQVSNIVSQNTQLKVGTAPIPKGLDNAAVSTASYWVEGVSKFSANQTEAWEFLVFLSEKEQQLKLHEAQAAVRPFGQAYSRVDMADLLKDHPYLAPVVSQAQDDIYVSLPVAARTFDGGMNDEILQYLENAITSTEEGVDYGAALSTASQGITTVLGRFNVVQSEEAAQPTP